MTIPSDPPGTPAGTPTSQPSDNTTMTEVLDGYRAAGFVTDFFAEEGGVRCAACASVLAPERMNVQSLRRLEGASDPAEMAAVVATSCPVCGADGTMVLMYGSAAGSVDNDVLAAMSDRRDEAGVPPSAAPDEMPSTD